MYECLADTVNVTSCCGLLQYWQTSLGFAVPVQLRDQMIIGMSLIIDSDFDQFSPQSYSMYSKYTLDESSC